MILYPSILALSVSSILISLMTLYAACYGFLILRRWDITSGSELQLTLERKTYLISSIISCCLPLQLVSLFLFVHTADSICHLFVGAMCAVGTLTANSFGYPTLLLKVLTFILAGLWLILNYADNQGHDYPLIRPKYLLLLIMAPIILAETVVQSLYFLRLRPDIITSCCGALFSQASRGSASDILAAPRVPMEIIFYSCMFVMLAATARFRLRGKGAPAIGLMSGVIFAVSIISIISFISVYFYEMPSHHCPFCIVQKEYGFIGYPLYMTLLLGTVTGLGVGALWRYGKKGSLAKIIPAIQQKLAGVSVTSFLIFTAIVTWQILVSRFKPDY